MGYQYKYRQTLIFLKNKYPENLFFCKKKIKKYNYLLLSNNQIIKKTKKNLADCSFKNYQQEIIHNGNLKSNQKLSKNFSQSTKRNDQSVLYNNTNFPSTGAPFFLSEGGGEKSPIYKNIILFTIDQLFSKLLFHGSGYKRFSNFFEKLREKKKWKILYGYRNRKYFSKRSEASTKFNGRAIAARTVSFEYNLNFLLCRCGFYSNVRKAEQMIKHGHYLLNNKKVHSHYTQIRRGDVISLKKGDIDLLSSPGKRAGDQISFLYKKLSLSTNKLKYRYFITEQLADQPKIFFILQKLHKLATFSH
jgi:ribosomal protein S4